jgi:hypothetical protein
MKKKKNTINGAHLCRIEVTYFFGKQQYQCGCGKYFKKQDYEDYLKNIKFH